MKERYSEYSSLIFESKWRAKAVIDRLTKLLAKHKVVSIADLYEIIGPEVVSKIIDNHYGWDDLTDAKVIRVNGGFSLDMPEPIELLKAEKIK